MIITIPVPLGGYVGDVIVGGAWFRPETEREEALAAELNARNEAKWISGAAEEIADEFFAGHFDYEKKVASILRKHRDKL